MKLHEDKYSFLNIIGLIHEASGIREDIIEKDYYVTLLLKELSEKQEELPAYFKGGTALYKAQKSIRRFSEDIDLTICIDGCSNSQAKKRLETATKKYKSLPRTMRKDLEDDRKGSITAVYDYVPLVTVDAKDPLQRFGYVKVEGTSFTVSEPFSINTIRLERIFADKIFAAEFFYERELYFDVAKHIYDVSVMLDIAEIRAMLDDNMVFREMLQYKRLEETRRTGSDLAEKKFSDFKIFDGFLENGKLKEAYTNMEKNYIFAEKDTLTFEFIVSQWKRVKEVLKEVD